MTYVAPLDDYRLPEVDEAARAAIDLAVEAEQGLLGYLLMYPDSYPSVAGMVRADFFVEHAHAALYEAIQICRKAGLRGTLSEIRQAVGEVWLAKDLRPNLDFAGYLHQLLVGGATSSTASDYARAVRAHWVLRSLKDITAGDRVGLPEDQAKAAFDRIDRLRMELEESTAARRSVGTIAQQVRERAEAIARGETEEPGVTTGIPDLDRAMLGFRPGELVIVAGRPGMGKTTLGTALALRCSDVMRGARHGGALYFALELGEEAIGARCLADLSYDRFDGPRHSDIRGGRLTTRQVDMLQRAECLLNERELEIDPRSSITVGEIEATCRAVARRMERDGRRLRVVFVDYLKQVSAGDRYRGNRVYEIGEITAGLRDIGKRLGLCMVLLTQLNRAVENREDKRPVLADLRESGDLENDADVVLLLYRDAYYLARDLKSAEPDKVPTLRHRLEMVEHELEIIIAKNRNGEGEHTIKVFCDIGRSFVTALDKRGSE